MEQFFRALKDRREASSSAGPGGETFLLVGLRNPGREYRETRHNFGFMVADRICERAGTAADKAQLKAITATTTINGRRVLIAKPQTFMNLSGQAVSALLRYYKIPLARLLVMHDDLDLPFGTLRMRPGGGSGGQKGLASTIEQLGTQDFARLRCGIDHPAGRMTVSDYVLSKFRKEEEAELPTVLDRAADAATAFVVDGIQCAMTKYNGKAD